MTCWGNAVVNRDVNGNFSFKTYDTEGRVEYEVDQGKSVKPDTHTTVRRPDAGYALREFHTLPSRAGGDHIRRSSGGLTLSPTADRTITSEYDHLGRVVTVTQSATYSFEPDLATSDATFVAGAGTLTEYNAFGEDCLLHHAGRKRQSGGHVLLFRQGRPADVQVDPMFYATTYQYDVFGNISIETQYAKPAFVINENTLPTFTSTTGRQLAKRPAGYDRVTFYEYDALNRKTSESLQSFGYSSFDNIILTQHTTNRTHHLRL